MGYVIIYAIEKEGMKKSETLVGVWLEDGTSGERVTNVLYAEHR